jgi:hypothetical protein
MQFDLCVSIKLYHLYMYVCTVDMNDRWRADSAIGIGLIVYIGVCTCAFMLGMLPVNVGVTTLLLRGLRCH